MMTDESGVDDIVVDSSDFFDHEPSKADKIEVR